MKPVVTPEEMRAIDAEAPEPVELLIERAGWATAQVAVRMLGQRGGVYGARVAVLAGKGNNGADGRSAACFLRRRGVHCVVIDVGRSDSDDQRVAGPFDLVVDACFGTGLQGEFWSSQLPIDVAGAPVLAVDIPSGVNGLTGQWQGRPLPATVTVTFAALKPGLLLEPGRSVCGSVEVVDIGLDCSRANVHVISEADLGRWPDRRSDAHKWRHAVGVVGGNVGMSGAAALASAGALRAGAGYVLKARPVSLSGDSGTREVAGSTPTEAVTVSLIDDYNQGVELLNRCASVVLGPGLGVDDKSQELAAGVLGRLEVSAVIDAGALRPDLLNSVVKRADAEQPLHVLTPHDGEFARITGRSVGPDRLGEARAAASELDAVVVLKGPTTVVAHPDGRVLISVAGDQRLATAGTGDVLAGVIGAGLALGLDPFSAAGLGVELHGRAGQLGASRGLIAGDLPALVSELLSDREA